VLGLAGHLAQHETGIATEQIGCRVSSADTARRTLLELSTRDRSHELRQALGDAELQRAGPARRAAAVGDREDIVAAQRPRNDEWPQRERAIRRVRQRLRQRQLVHQDSADLRRRRRRIRVRAERPLDRDHPHAHARRLPPSDRIRPPELVNVTELLRHRKLDAR